MKFLTYSMKIILASTILNPNGERPKSLTIRTSRRTKTESVIGAVNAIVFDRGNSSTTASFEIIRSHPSEEAAEIFAMSHAEDLKKSLPATLEFKMLMARRNFNLDGCTLAEIKIAADSLTTITKYEFTGRNING